MYFIGCGTLVFTPCSIHVVVGWGVTCTCTCAFVGWGITYTCIVNGGNLGTGVIWVIGYMDRLTPSL